MQAITKEQQKIINLIKTETQENRLLAYHLDTSQNAGVAAIYERVLSKTGYWLYFESDVDDSYMYTNPPFDYYQNNFENQLFELKFFNNETPLFLEFLKDLHTFFVNDIPLVNLCLSIDDPIMKSNKALLELKKQICNITELTLDKVFIGDYLPF